MTRRTLEPTGEQLELTLEYRWDHERRDEPGDVHELTLESRVPFAVWKQPSLLRIKVPYEVETQGADGVGTVEMVAAALFSRTWGTLAAGPVVFLAERDGGGGHRPEAGPAAGFVWKPGRLLLGLFTQTLFAEGVARSVVQPVVGVTLTDWLTLGSGNPEFEIDWREPAVTSIPLGLEAGVTMKLAGQSVSASVNPEVNFATESGTPRWSLTLSVGLIVPEGHAPAGGSGT